jgi:ribosome-binding protein aMBF1 (putative translation factor)
MSSSVDAATANTARLVTRRPKASLGADPVAVALRETFGTNLKAARERAGLSQQSVADQIATDIGHVSRIESGKVNVTLGTATRLAQAVGADVRDLLGLCSGKPTKKPPGT